MSELGCIGMQRVESPPGAVVSMSSVASLVPNRGQSNYAAAKAGLNAASSSYVTGQVVSVNGGMI